ncbi:MULTISPECIES: alpha/beta hydrolase [Nostocales]|uniref:Alpha/beta hydrolase n=2 Tax=Nostocales TaxID=1161 RepID=A0ABW8WYH5_9CYAN|nr:alpha/beta hydrolase [Tolypothrix bouteillei]
MSSQPSSPIPINRDRSHLDIFYTKIQKFLWLKIGLGFFSLGLLTPLPSLGAERLTLSFGVLGRSIPIGSLEEYAHTGKVDDELAAYTQHADTKQLNQLREVLLTPIPLTSVQVSQFLYTPIGETLLKNLGEVVQQDSGISGFYAIRASLILAAAEPKGLTLLNVLKRFPSRTISINLPRSLEIAAAFERLVNQTQRTLALINEQSSQEVAKAFAGGEVSVRELLKPGSFKWQKRTIILNDISRTRTFPADVYLPLTSGSRSVVVISHGLGSDRTSFAYLAEYLASYGFVVAVPEHPGSNAEQLQALLSGRANEVASPREFVDRPLDIKYLLDQLSSLSQSDGDFKGRLNLEQVGVVGQSFGGYTALVLAGAPINFDQLKKNCPASPNAVNVSLLLQCLAINLPPIAYNLSDSRVKAALAINQIDSTILGQASLSKINIPVMTVAGGSDTVAPALPEQIQPFTWLTTPNKYLVLVNNATHFSTIAESPNSAIPVPDSVVGPNPAIARRYITALSLPFFQTYVANQPSYRRFLSAGYANAISQEPLPLSLVQSLNLDAARSKESGK